MFAGTGKKRKDAHSKTKQCEISEDHIQRMPHRKVFPAFAFAGRKKLLLGKNRIRTNACAEKFSIVVVMIIVRTFQMLVGARMYNPNNEKIIFAGIDL